MLTVIEKPTTRARQSEPTGGAHATRATRPRSSAVLCTGCRQKEARYGFGRYGEPDRPSTLCYPCFRLELEKRQPLPPYPTRDAIWSRRRRRAQIAARKALGLAREPTLFLLR